MCFLFSNKNFVHIFSSLKINYFVSLFQKKNTQKTLISHAPKIVPLSFLPLYPCSFEINVPDPLEGSRLEINRFQVVPAFRTFYDFQASIYDTVYFTCHYYLPQASERHLVATFDASAHSLGSRTVPIFVQSSQAIDRNPSQSNCRMLKLD